MWRRTCAALALLLVLTQAAGAVFAAAPEKRLAIIALDPTRTRIIFTLKGFPHTTTGWFQMKRGAIRIDPKTGAADGNIIIDAATATTGISMRDSEMRNSILETPHYPEISFVPRQATGRPMAHGEFTVSVSGLLFLHGGRHDLSLNLAIKRNGDDFTATSRLTIPYVRWGLKNPSLLFLTVSDEVAIDVSTAGHVTWIPVSN